MTRLHWMTKLIAIVFVFAPFNLWVWDALFFRVQGFAMVLALLWVPSIALAIVTILLWESAHDKWLVRLMSRISFVSAWVNLVLMVAFLVDIFVGSEAFPSVPVSMNDFLISLSAIYAMILLPAAMTFIPVHILYFSGDSRRRTVFSIAAPFVLVASWFVISQHGEDFLRSYHDPCYEVVEGKITSPYQVKDGRVCVVYYETVFGESFYRTLQGADVDSFEAIGYAYGKDKNRVYKGEEVLEAVDPSTFHNEDDLQVVR